MRRPLIITKAHAGLAKAVLAVRKMKFNRSTMVKVTSLVVAVLIFLSVFPVACRSVNGKHKHNLPFPVDPTENDRLPAGESYAGLSSVTGISATQATLTWAAFPYAIGYQIFYREGDHEFWTPGESFGPDVFSYTVTGLTPSTIYTFNVQALLTEEFYDGNEVTKIIQTLGVPSAPSGLTLATPATSFKRTTTVVVSGVEPGATVKLFTDNLCSPENVVASGVVAAEASTISLTTNTLGEAPASYTFYAQSTSAEGLSSPCSTANVAFNIVACASELYVPVEGNLTLGTSAFCVMKTEAKKGAGNIPVAQYASNPWAYISATNAKAACKTIVPANGTCDLVSNPQWMTMAWDIESVAANWSSGVVGNGFLNRGHSDRSPQASLAITDATNAWSQTNNDDSDWGQKRTHTFSTGGVIWDLAGNLYEWVDWTTGGESFSVGPTTCDLYGPPYEVSCAALNPNDYLPLNPAGIDHAEYNHTNYNLGFIWGGDGGAILRGGSYLDNAVAGLYSLNFDNVPSFSYTAVGFRCACTAASGLIGP